MTIKIALKRSTLLFFVFISQLFFTSQTLLAKGLDTALMEQLEQLGKWQRIHTQIEMTTTSQNKEKHLLLHMYREKKDNIEQTLVHVDPRSDYSSNMRVLGKIENEQLTQWVYLPRSKNLKKIKSKGARRFFKTALIFEDILLLEGKSILNLYKISGTNDKAVTLIANDEQAYYARMEISFSEKSNEITQIEMFNQQQKLIKRMSNIKITEDDQGRRFPQHLIVEEILKNRKTEIRWPIYKLDPPEFIPDFFTTENLKRGFADPEEKKGPRK